ncbi:condensation domain-containing protein, partial [Sphingomonas sp. LB2R24]|uniref:condensation domain-containing protein n=1 Tax=Sphingomonas sorbitolis TaxID=3096165 RepID=UPI002FC9BC3C
TPSDLPLVSLDQAEIERLESEHRGVSDVLPLSPLQQGLLFHSLYDDETPHVYLVQLVLDLTGHLDTERLRTAAQALLIRHPHLAAAFLHEGFTSPIQTVPKAPDLPWSYVDLSSLSASKREASLNAFIERDRSIGFTPSCSPLLRFALVRLTAGRHRLIFTHHHILLDGWSISVFWQELFILYRAGVSRPDLPTATPYRDYLAWLQRQDRSLAEAAWRDAFEGLTEPTRLAPSSTSAPVPAESVQLELSLELTTSLSAFAWGNGLTLNTVVQLAWAMLLASETKRNDVVFGITVAGRPPELPGMERMVGLFINTVPLRLRLRPKETILQLLARLQEEQSRLLAHQHLGLSEIQRLAGVGELFDTL